jgi:hypothetical protein
LSPGAWSIDWSDHWRRGRLAEGVGFEPTVGKPTPVFKTGTFGRSVIPPGTTILDGYFFL